MAWMHFSSVQSLHRVWLFETPWTVACQASLSITHTRNCSNSCPSSWWCHPAISSSVIPFSSCLQSFPALGSFPLSQFFASVGQSIGISASASNEYSGLISFRMDWLDVLAVQGALKSLFQHHIKSINFSALSFLHSPTLTSIHDHWKSHSLD